MNAGIAAVGRPKETRASGKGGKRPQDEFKRAALSSYGNARGSLGALLSACRNCEWAQRLPVRHDLADCWRRKYSASRHGIWACFPAASSAGLSEMAISPSREPR